MLTRFFPHGERVRYCGRRAVNYLCNEVDPVSKKLREPGPEIIAGDPLRVARLIDSLSFKYVYTSGVMAWAPGETVSPEQEAEAIRRFKSVAFGGFEHDRYECLLVRHRHEGSHEIHFLVPRVELLTGKSFNIAPPGHEKLYRPMRREYNLEMGFSDPDDPERRREFSLPNELQARLRRAEKKGVKLEKDIGECKSREELHEKIKKWVVRGIAQDRGDIVTLLKGNGYEIPREGDHYITVRDPRIENTKGWRLKGEFYERDFNRQITLDRRGGRIGQEEDRRAVPDIRAELAKLHGEVQRLTAKRAEHNRKHYPRPKLTVPAIELELPKPELGIGDDRRGAELASAAQLEQAKNNQLEKPGAERVPTVSGDPVRERPVHVAVLVENREPGVEDRAATRAVERGQAEVLGPAVGPTRGVWAEAARDPTARGADRSEQPADSSRKQGIGETGSLEAARSLAMDGGLVMGAGSESGPGNEVRRGETLGTNSIGEAAHDERVRAEAHGLFAAIAEGIRRAREQVDDLLRRGREAFRALGERVRDLGKGLQELARAVQGVRLSIQQGDRAIEQYIKRTRQQKQELDLAPGGRGGRGL